jgi:hypothetical protein
MKRPAFSTLTTWLVRILLGIVILIGIAFLVLSVLGGTSDSHKAGLEQAFSDALKADIRIGTLREFNIVPVLSLRAEQLRGIYPDSGNEFMADRFAVAFRFTDLLTGRNRLADFEIDNLRFSKDSALDFSLARIAIAPGPAPALAGSGRFEGRDLNFALPLTGAGTPPTYILDASRPATGRFGALALSSADAGKPGATGMLERIAIASEGRKIGEAARVAGQDFRMAITCHSSAMPDAARADIVALGTLPFIELAGSCR